MSPTNPQQAAAELARYRYEPLGVTRNGGEWPEPRFERVLIACARWEAPYINEWLSYHRSIGIDHVYLYCNDDDPGDLWEAASGHLSGPEPFVTFHHHPFQGAQYQMYYHAVRHHAHEARWLMFLDVDEFLCVRNSNRVSTVLDTIGAEADAVYFNWIGYGNNGHAVRPRGSVLLNYTRRERTVTPFTKVFIRSRKFPLAEFFTIPNAPVMHDYLGLRPDLKAVNVLGDDMHGYYEDFAEHAWNFLRAEDRQRRIAELAFVAHFNMKSDADFDLRVARGLAGDYASEASWGRKTAEERAAFHHMTNAIEDHYLSDYWRATRLRDGWRDSVIPRSDWPRITPTGPALQSSTAHKRALTEDAEALLSRRLLGRPQSHTLAETDPWWTVDLGARYRVHEIRLFNRLDGVFERMARFTLECSIDGDAWSLFHSKQDDALYGGADGTPYRAIEPDGVVTRWIALRVPGVERYLHLDQIEIFGERVGD